MSVIKPNKPIFKAIGTAIGSTYPNQSLTTTPVSDLPYTKETVIRSPKQVPSYNNKAPERKNILILGTIHKKIPNVPIPGGYKWVNVGSSTKPQWTLERSQI